jgi:hypothetical protein
VGFFSSLKESNPDDGRIRAYLDGAPPGSRLDWLAWGGFLRVADTPIAAADAFGRPVTVADVRPAAELVRGVMRQDRDLTGPLVRKALVNLKSVVAGMMSGAGEADTARAFEAMGVDLREEGFSDFLPGVAEGFCEEDAAGARALADVVGSLLLLVLTDPRERPALGVWTLYSEFFAAEPGGERETLAYDLVAWIDVLIARLFNTGSATRPPFLTDQFRHVPELTEPGWYPTPNKNANVVDGVATLQRYWDGIWTDDVRVKSGRDWKSGSHSLDDPNE